MVQKHLKTPRPAAAEGGMISCLTITQEGRQALLAKAIADFNRQTWAHRELVIVHDAPAAFHDALQSSLPSQPNAPIRLYKAPAGLTLGALRNVSIDQANGEFICQWDDDDRYHPQRLAVQMDALQQAGAGACFLADQLHHFAEQAVLRWDDWNLERYPYNLIPGTLLARRSALARYQELRRGEDSGQVDDLLRRGVSLTSVREKGWLYIYTHTGKNTFSEAHHQAISNHKPLRAARVLCLERELRTALADYQPPLPKVRMPLSSGELVF